MTERRVFLQGLASLASFAAMPRLLRAEFPPQGVIDNDPLRPRFHLMGQRGWMNDPCGPIFYKGKYHMFFQSNPGASVWGDMHWAHAVSTDMVHWKHRPFALAPTPGGPDSAGVFTGTAVIQDGKPVVIYTAVRRVPHAEATIQDAANNLQESQCLATPDDDSLDTWTKLPRPVIARPPDGMKVTGFRDPTPWREKDGWYMLVASGQRGIGGNVLLYKSADLRSWQYLKIFAQGKPTPGKGDDAVDTGEMWECPDFFPLGDRHVLIHSVGSAEGRVTLWQTGHLDRATMTFTPGKEGVLNHGPYYAPKTQMDADGNRILWGWIPETRPEAEFARAGWAGCMSLPRVVTQEDGELRFAPAKQVESLRGPIHLGAETVEWRRSEPQHEAVITIELDVMQNGPQPIKRPFLSSVLSIDFDPALREGQLRLGHRDGMITDRLPPKFHIRCFADRSVLEIFVGDRCVVTTRMYGEGAEPYRIRLSSSYKMVGSQGYAMSAI